MKIRTCSKELVASMISMPSSSKGQNQAVKDMMDQGFPLDQCYVIVRDEEVVCRILVETDVYCLSCFTIEDIEQQEVDTFLKEVISTLDQSKVWRIDLYSDKIHHDKIEAACMRYCSARIERESYTISCTAQDISMYDFRSYQTLTEDEVCHLIQVASSSTLDMIIQQDQKERGQEREAKKTMRELAEGKDAQDLFQILFIDHEPVGFVAVNELIQGVGGVGYIGVDPQKQGNQYSSILLKKAVDMAYHHEIKKLIGDIDVHNFAIRKNLLQVGFQKDCDQVIYHFHK